MALSLFAIPSFAGGYLTTTNQNTAFYRMPAHNATIGTEGAYYDPAGIAFMKDGWHVSLDIQSVWQRRHVNSTFAPFAYRKGNDGSNQRKYIGVTNVPVLPHMDLAFKKDRWFGSFHFGPIAGGGSAKFSDGLGSFEANYAMLPVWLFTYKYKDKDYTFMVNGQTGKVVGEPPVSKLKVGENSLNLSVWGLSTDELGNDLGGLMYDMIKLERKNSTIQVISEETAMGFNGETVDNPTGLTAITNFNNTGFYLRGSNDYKIPLRVPGKDTRQFTFSDGTVYASQNFVTLQGQSKNDYSSFPAANDIVNEASRLNIGFQTTVPGTVYIAFQSQNSPADGSALRLVLNGTVVKSASLQTAAAKTARLDVLEYTADEAGTFFIDSYKSASNVFYVRFVPTGESTGIMAVTKPQTTHHTEVYNLNGQRVAHPVKGLYIINGKKVVIR